MDVTRRIRELEKQVEKASTDPNVLYAPIAARYFQFITEASEQRISLVPWTKRLAALRKALGLRERLTEPEINIGDPSNANDIRALGWMVAVHNDYLLGDVPYAFWLFTNSTTGKFVKGEGRTDADALNEVRKKLRMI